MNTADSLWLSVPRGPVLYLLAHRRRRCLSLQTSRGLISISIVTFNGTANCFLDCSDTYRLLFILVRRRVNWILRQLRHQNNSMCDNDVCLFQIGVFIYFSDMWQRGMRYETYTTQFYLSHFHRIFSQRPKMKLYIYLQNVYKKITRVIFTIQQYYILYIILYFLKHSRSY